MFLLKTVIAHKIVAKHYIWINWEIPKNRPFFRQKLKPFLHKCGYFGVNEKRMQQHEAE